MNDRAMFEVFDETSPEEHQSRAAEAEERWGDTDQWATSRRRTSEYTTDDWVTIKAEQAEREEAIAQVLRAGDPAESEGAMDAAEGLRLHIERWYYPCSHDMHANLGEMYVMDERFTAHYDDREPGLAAFVRDAIVANGLRSV